MKKYLNFLGIFVFLLICMSFIIIGPKKYKISQVSERKPTCNCGTPTNLQAVRSGGVVHVSWNAATNAVNYSVGGYKSSCSPPVGFNYCASGLSYDIPSSCSITVQVTANCDGTSCTDATCSGGTAGPVVSN